ncbi:MAG TPA: outer membrane beta-barrel protein [Verrucomicrobiae bacterium]|nr:outer membrane beta-barrel protein [Verrucomicrobiae bacterium]
MKPRTKRNHYSRTVGLCLGAVVGGSALMRTVPAHAQDVGTNKLEKLEKENQDLKKRLDLLEAMAQKEGLLPSGSKSADPPVSALSDITLSGFVTTSYFHDSTMPPASMGRISPGYLWNRVSDSFSLNKVKITLASPQVQNTGEKWDAGYRVSLIAGQDAPIVNTKSGVTGFDYLREAYVELNVPIGTGLDVRVGELISLLNYESGDGGAVNANFSQGFQWFFTGNPPAAGVQLGYKFTDWLNLTFRVENGLYAGPIDNNRAKTYMGAIGIKPFDKLWFSLLGFGGREEAGFTQSLWGGSLLGGWNATDQLAFGTELDYFNFHNPNGSTPSGNSPVWSTGLWATYDFTKKVGVAVRGEFLSDSHGVDASGGALGFLNPPGTGQDLSSVALTLNYKPVPTIKIQPEIRFDHTSWAGGFVPGHQNRFVYGAGVSYLF